MRVAWLQSLTPLDYLVIGIMFMALLIGWARGFVEVLSSFLVFLVSTFVAGRYTGPVLGVLNRTWDAQGWLSAIFERRLNLPPEAYKIPASAIPLGKALDFVQALPLPAAYKLTLAERLADWSGAAGNQTAAHFIVNQLSAGVLSAAIFLVMAGLLSWVLAIAVKLVSDQLKEIPLVGATNRLLGSIVVGTEVAAGLALIVGLVGPMLSMYGGAKLGNAIGAMQLSPYFLTLYEWLRTVLFGMGGGTFFIS